ncbi:Fumarylacetoacetase C-terminal-like protein [Penicillium expansum]|nr:Fumarylacetoacetase C-terminal-like protein [Penicillium expansum]
MSLPWKRLIRFIATDGRILRGEPILPTPTTDLGFITESDKLQARVIEGDDLYDTTGKTRVTDEIVSVKTVLGPLAQADVPILRCVGLNYAKHVKEAGRTPPPLPIHFLQAKHHNPRPRRTSSNPTDRPGLTGRLRRRAGETSSLFTNTLSWVKTIENALSYVAAYTVGNDISARKLQRDPALAGRVPQWGFSKGFDTFAPLGPCLVAASEIADPSKLLLKTIVDGEVRQEEYVADLLFDCAYLVSYLLAGYDVAEGECYYDGDAWWCRRRSFAA